MAQIRYNGRKPIYKSEFLDNAIKKENYESHFLGYAIDMNNNRSDLFFITYESGEHNAIVKFGKQDQDYSSGISFMYRDAALSKTGALNTLYRRAVKSGLLLEKTAYVGYSPKYQEKIDDAYFYSDYFKGLPEFYCGSDEEKSKEYELNVEEYNKNYAIEFGEVPKEPENLKYHIFESKEEAIKLCGEHGVFEKISYSNENHLREIVDNKNFFGKAFNNAMKTMKF